MYGSWFPFSRIPPTHTPTIHEIRLINTSVPKIKSWNCSIIFFSSQTFCWDVMEIVTTKLSIQNCGGGISREKGAHPRKVLCLRSSEGNLCIITTHLHYPCPNKGNFSTPNVWFTIVFGEPPNQLPPPLDAHTPSKYCRDLFHLHQLSLTTPKTVNLVKRSS